MQINGVTYSSQQLQEYIRGRYDIAEEWEQCLYDFMLQWLSDSDEIALQTSGSTGQPRQIVFPKSAFEASARATINYFDIQPDSNLLLCLPAQYVAARLMVVRAFVGNCNLVILPPSGNPLAQLTVPIDFAALVPLQVSNALSLCPEKFALISKMIVGGSSVSDTLKAQLASVTTSVWETYGMTETLTHVAVKQVNGMDGDCFEALPGVTFSKNDSDCLVVYAPHIATNEVATNDIVQLVDNKRFTLLGRADCVINTGGVKVQAEIIEAKLSALISIPFAVFGSPDERLGQQVTLVVEGKKLDFNFELLFQKAELTKFEWPRLIVECQKLPLTDSGKIKRSELVNLRRES